jgi:hypothetical protein
MMSYADNADHGGGGRPGGRSLVEAEARVDETTVEAALRPRTLEELIGQSRVKDQLGWCWRQRGVAAGHRTTCCSRVHPGWARRHWR